MSLNYTTLPVQLAQELRILRKREALWEHMHELFVDVSANYDRRLLVAANAYGTSVPEENQAITADYAALVTQATTCATLYTSYRSTFASAKGFFGVLKHDLTVLTKNDQAVGAIKYTYNDLAGVISIKERQGYLGALRREMALDGYYVLACTITIGALTAANGNVGTLTKTSATGESHALNGTLEISVDDDNVGAPKLKIVNRLTRPLPDGTVEVPGDNQLQPEKSWEDGPTGLTITLTRGGLATPTEAGDDGNMFSASSISTPSESDSDHGKIYVKVTRQATAPIWLIQWYKDSSLTTLVQQTTTDTVLGTYAVDMTGGGGMRFQSTFDRVNANVQLAAAGNADSDITFDIKSPRIGDRWTMSCATDEAGLYSTKLSHLYRVSLPVAGATAQFTDANASSISVS